MTHPIQPSTHTSQPLPPAPRAAIGGTTRHRERRGLALLIPVAGLLLALASCAAEVSPSAPVPVPMADTQPIGEGLKVIGYAMLGAAVVAVLGRLLR